MLSRICMKKSRPHFLKSYLRGKICWNPLRIGFQSLRNPLGGWILCLIFASGGNCWNPFKIWWHLLKWIQICLEPDEICWHMLESVGICWFFFSNPAKSVNEGFWNLLESVGIRYGSDSGKIPWSSVGFSCHDCAKIRQDWVGFSPESDGIRWNPLGIGFRMLWNPLGRRNPTESAGIR